MKPSIYLNLIFLLHFIGFASCEIVPETGLDCKILVQFQKTLTESWLKVLEEAYKKYMIFIEKWTGNLDALSLKKVGEFQVAANHCFDAVKGRTLTKIEELEAAMKSINGNLKRAISIGVCAVGELATLKLKALYGNLIQIIEKLDAAYRLTQNFLQNTSKGSNPTQLK